jgi:uncharacterized protein involved in exopolysaccharide biosynthesis
VRASPPPRLADWLLQRLATGRRQQSILGDLHEQYRRGRSVAWYWRQTITTILVGPMKQRLLWVLVPTVVTAAITATLSYYFVPTRYQSEALVLIVPQQVPESSVPSSVDTHIENRLQTMTRQILSRTRLERIIVDFNLYSEQRKKAVMADVVDGMRSSIGIQIDGGDSFRVRFTSNEPKTAQHVTERLVSLFIEENLRGREFLADATNNFLDARIANLRRQIIETEGKLRNLRATTSGELSQADLLPYEVLKDSYKSLLVRRLNAPVEANLERRQNGQQFKILDPARFPEAPVGPSKTTIDVGGALVGLAFGLVMVGVVSVRQKKQPEPTQV